VNTEHKSNTAESIRDLWRTPLPLFQHLNDEFDFDVDVAASDRNHLCKKYLTEKEDALKCSWGLNNWLNPPYSNIGPWVDKAIYEHNLGSTTVMLVPSDTSVKWFKRAFDSCNEVRFISGRLSFVNAETGKSVGGNNKGSVLFVWRAGCPQELKSIALIERANFY